MSYLKARLTRRQFLGGCLAGAGAGAFAWYSFSQPAQAVHQVQWYSFGTLLEVSIVDNDRDKVETALKLLASEFGQRNRDWHPWKAGQIQDINRALASGEVVPVDTHIAHMVQEIQRLHAQSQGSFNPTIGRMVSEWGFHGQDKDGWHPPQTDNIERMLADAPSPDDLQLVDDQLSSRNPAVKLDLGGYAKGYALDLGLDLMQSMELEHVLINAGGDLVSSGWQYHRPWMIGIRNPRGSGAIGWIETRGKESVFTSGTYERYHYHEGKRYAHIINPRNGQPANEIASATVLHNNSAVADAAATAIVVEGLHDWQQTAEAMGIDHVMVIDQKGRIDMTGAMRERIRLV